MCIFAAALIRMAEKIIIRKSRGVLLFGIICMGALTGVFGYAFRNMTEDDGLVATFADHPVLCGFFGVMLLLLVGFLGYLVREFVYRKPQITLAEDGITFGKQWHAWDSIDYFTASTETISDNAGRFTQIFITPRLKDGKALPKIMLTNLEKNEKEILYLITQFTEVRGS